MLTCDACGEALPQWSDAWRCACGGPLTWNPDHAAAAPPPGSGLWRYADQLPPVSAKNRISLGETITPVFEDPQTGTGYKLEHFAPTGSFKDRGACVVASCLREINAAEVVLDSSGNAGAAMAGYLAAAGLRATVFAPAHASPTKLDQIRAYGATLRLVSGDRGEVTRRAQEYADRGHEGGARYASHLWSPFFVAGMRTFAHELCANRPAPDAVLFPVGSGSLLLGAFEGFTELVRAGRIDRLPRLYGVQSAACAPLVEAFAAGRDAISAPAGSGTATAAEGILIAEPPRHRAILRAVRESGGALLTVDEPAIWDAWTGLARSGVFVEPTSAVAEAGRRRLAATGVVAAGPETIVALTGSGLKAA
jgi:threonine synthase